MPLASHAFPCISCFCSYLSTVSSISSSSMALLVYQSWVELGLVLELQWLIGPFSSFPFRLSESIKRLSPTTLKRSNPLIKQLYLTHLNWVFLLVERSLRRSLIFSGVGLVMSKYPSLVIASHQAAMNFSNLMYAFPLSISSAMAIIISYEFGG